MSSTAVPARIDPEPKFGSTLDGYTQQEAHMSAATAESEVETPTILVDPTMAENRKAAVNSGPSFSEIDELPPLKEVYVAPPPPPSSSLSPDGTMLAQRTWTSIASDDTVGACGMQCMGVRLTPWP